MECELAVGSHSAASGWQQLKQHFRSRVRQAFPRPLRDRDRFLFFPVLG
jgi:hypothetical protein